MGRGFVCLTVGFVLLAPFARASTLGLPKPDLTIDTVPLVTVASGLSAQWVVRNLGKAPSPATKLKLLCTRVFADSPGSACGSSPSLTDIPPIDSGGSYKVQTSGVATIDAIGPHGQRYRFNLTATVDPSNLIAETNENNNATTYVAENFKGDPYAPSAAAVTKVATVVQLVTNPAHWDPAKKAWLIVKNVGPIDAPPLTIQMTCMEKVGYTGYTLQEQSAGGPDIQWVSCGSLLNQAAQSWQIPALLKGHFEAVFELSIPASGTILLPGNRLYLGATVTFHVATANVICPDLVLSNMQ